MTNQEVINKTICLLEQESEWCNRYDGYAKEINKHIDKYKNASKGKFQIKFPLSAYTSITKLKQGEPVYDIRFLGQSIGSICVKSDGVWFKVADGYTDLITKRGISTLPKLSKNVKLEWGSSQMSSVRSVLKNTALDICTKSPEHKFENLLLKEFRKSKASEKSLCNIQPVDFANKFMQLSTPLSASKHSDIKYSKQNGGGIDILARVRHNDNKVYLCVMELKDENNKQEPVSVVIQQALCYATFLALLLQSESGEKWKKLFGFSGKIEPIIDVVALMPNNSVEKISSEDYKVGDYTLSTHALYFDKEALLKKDKFTFSGDFLDVIKPK